MSLDSDVLAIPGLISYWKLTDRTGTNAPDSGPANMPITLTAPADGPSLTTGGGASLAGDGATVRGSTANLPAAHPLRFAAGASFTLAAWVNGKTPSGTKTLFGRNNRQWMRYGSSGNAFMVGASGIHPTLSALTTGTPTFLAMTWDNRESMLFVNGLLEVAVPGDPGVDDSNEGFEVLSLGGGQHANADIERVFAVGRAMGSTELRALYLEGAATPYLGLSSYVDAQDVRPVVLSSPSAGRCFSCAGTMRANEASIVIGVNRRHVSCYAGRFRAVPATRPSEVATMTDTDIGGQAARAIYDNLWTRAWRSTPAAGRTAYFDGATATWIYPAGTGLSEIAGFAAGAAALHHLSGTASDSWLVRMAKATIEQYIRSQELLHGPGSGFYEGAYGPAGDPGPVWGLSAAYAFETYLWLGNVLDDATKNRWKASFIKAGEYHRRVQQNWYTNGNVEVGELMNLWLLYRITGDDSWLADYEDQLVRLANPPAGMGNVNSTTSAFNWTWSVTPTQADGSDGQGFFGEKNSSGGVPGFDQIYTAVQLGHLERTYAWNHDVRLVKYINGTLNKLIPYINTTSGSYTSPQGVVLSGPWQMDATNGSRNNVITGFGAPTFMHMIRNPSLRTANPISSSIKYAVGWTGVETDMRLNRSIFGNFARSIGETIVPWLYNSPIWPGMPED